MWPNPQFPADLVTFTEEIFNGKLHFLCSFKQGTWISPTHKGQISTMIKYCDIAKFEHRNTNWKRITIEKVL